MVFRYGMRARGFGTWCQPLNGLVDHEEDPTGKYYDILVYDRALSDDQVEEYELDRIKDEP